jgi:hypothetical protein
MRTRPLTLAAVGLVAIGLDMRVVAWDLLPDVVGWLLIALAGWRLTMRSAAALALAAAVASLADVHIPYRYDAIDPLTGEVVVNPKPGLAYHELLAYDPVSGARLVLLGVAFAAGGAALWILLRELARRAVAYDDPSIARRLRLLAWGVVLGWATPVLLRMLGQGPLSDGEFDTVWNGGWEMPALIGLVVLLATAFTFATHSNRRWSATGDELGSPWAELMVRSEQSEDF